MLCIMLTLLRVSSVESSEHLSAQRRNSLELFDKVLNAKRIYLIGNGGSYANALHIANDLLLCNIRAFTLDPATLTACANDYEYSTIFARWISAVGEPGDLLIALSGSGKSPNILKAVQVAKDIGMLVHEEYGAAQGFDMQASEEHQLWVGHELRRRLKSLTKL